MRKGQKDEAPREGSNLLAAVIQVDLIEVYRPRVLIALPHNPPFRFKPGTH